MFTLHNGDCLTVSDEIESGSVDLILSDLPYGNMDTEGGRKLGINGWDVPIEPKDLFRVSDRILRNNGRAIFFSQEPYTNRLINNAIPSLPFSYRAIWEKDNFANALGVNKNMVSFFEDVLVFSKVHYKHDFEISHPLRPYFEKVFVFIGLSKKELIEKIGQKIDHTFRFGSSQFSLCTEPVYNELIRVFKIDNMEGFINYTELKGVDIVYRRDLIEEMNGNNPSVFNLWEGKKYKSNILKYAKDYDGLHPTQKPVLLIEDLIRTFSNEGDWVVDFTMGSGTTIEAAERTGRNSIGIEKDEGIFQSAVLRLKSFTPSNNRLHLTGGGLPATQSSFTAEVIPPAKLPAKSPRR